MCLSSAEVRPDDAPDIDWTNAGVLPHKTAATQSGLGWIGKTAVFVSARFGAAVRLATVFTDVLWVVGQARGELYDVKPCELKSWDHPEWAGACGVCQAVCPYTKGALKRESL